MLGRGHGNYSFECGLLLLEEEAEGKSLSSLFAKEEEEDANHVYGFWHLLPDLLLEKIFQHLTIRERYYASQVWLPLLMLVCYI